MNHFNNLKAILSSILILNFGFSLCDIITYDTNNKTLNTFESLTASFGPDLPDDGFVGYINPSNPLDGCTKIEAPPNVSFVDASKWIALIQRTPSIFGNCSFDVKVHNAQQAGYAAVIIFNSESDNLIKMSSSGRFNIKIPSVFAGHSDGLDLKVHYTYKNGTYVSLTNDSDLSYFLIPFVSVICVCFLTAVCIFSIKLILHCRKIRKNRFPRSALKKIPTKKYQKTDRYDTCPICLNEYEEGVKIRILPCEHAYHIECIDKWLLRNNRLCPVCKRKVLPGDSDSENEDSAASSTNPETQPLLVENEANNQDENESTALLSQNNHDDNSSVLTTSTNLNNFTLGSNQNNNEISSLNNHMTRSMTSQIRIDSGASNAVQTKDQATSASRYGSISSINLADNTNQTNQDSYQQTKGKQTPDYYSVPTESAFEHSAEASNSDSVQRINEKGATKKSNPDEVVETKEVKIKKKNSRVKPITNINVSQIAASLEKENSRKEDASDERDSDCEKFQSVNENEPITVKSDDELA